MQNKFNIPLLWQGVFWKIISCGSFAVVNALVRFLSGGAPIKIAPLPIYTIIMLQNLIGLGLLLPYVLKLEKKYFVTPNLHLHILRVTLSITGIASWYLSLRYIPIMQAVALSFAGPIVTIIGARLFLKEHFTWPKMVAVGLSLIGGLLIIRPDKILFTSNVTGNFSLGVEVGLASILPFIAATIFATDKLITRRIMQHHKESPLVLTFYLLLASTFACTAIDLYKCHVVGLPFAANLSGAHLPWVMLLGCAATVAHFAFSKAYELAEVTWLMPFGLSKVILSAVVSYFAFYELPNSLAVWTGMIVIFLSSLSMSFNCTKKYKAEY